MLNDYQKTLYDNLMALCSPDQEAFYYVDQKSFHQDKDYNGEEVLFRIFLYRLASYTEFLKPGALECRGHTFRIDENGNALEFVSMPMNKFFNLGENPFVMDLDLSTIHQIMDKLDGSLISTVSILDGEDFILKSKGSLNSTQAKAATKLLYSPEYAELLTFCKASACVYGYTVNMEYMSPDNRIVIGYMKPTLKVLNVRNNKTGEYIDPSDYDDLSEQFRVAFHPLPDDGHAWANSVAAMEDDIEGYCVRLKDGTWFKLKTDKYKALHHTKDSINVPRRLFEACVLGAADDLRSMFATDALACLQIDEMMEKVSKIYNHLDKTVREFYEKHKDAYNDTENPRKYYAIAGQKDAEIQKMGIFGLVMNLYVGKDADVADFMIKHYKDYGIKDEPVVELDA